jgi:hypothetical protein
VAQWLLPHLVDPGPSSLPHCSSWSLSLTALRLVIGVG